MVGVAEENYPLHPGLQRPVAIIPQHMLCMRISDRAPEKQNGDHPQHLLIIKRTAGLHTRSEQSQMCVVKDSQKLNECTRWRIVNNRERILQEANWLKVRILSRSVILFVQMCIKETTGATFTTELTGISAIYVLRFVHFPCVSVRLFSILFSPYIEDERQTHFHTNRTRTCSPGAQWNYKHLFSSWECFPLLLITSVLIFLFTLDLYCFPLCNPLCPISPPPPLFHPHQN